MNTSRLSTFIAGCRHSRRVVSYPSRSLELLAVMMALLTTLFEVRSAATPDFVFRDPVTGSDELWIMNNFNGTDAKLLWPDPVSDLNWQIMATGDFNADGKTDLVWQNNSTEEIVLWYMAGQILKSGGSFYPSMAGQAGWRIAGVADFNLDGKPDLVWQHTAGTSPSGQIAIWYMDGPGMFGATLTSPSGAGIDWRVVATADFNDNGRPDLVLQHVNGTVAIWYMDNATLVSGTLTNPDNPGDPGWRIADAADMNLDGKPDLVWQHTSGETAIWWMNGANMLNAALTNPSALNPSTLRLAAVGDFTLMADTDADGLPDSWETQYFGHLNWNRDHNPDGDGTNNGQEYTNGTNPALFDYEGASRFGEVVEGIEAHAEVPDTMGAIGTNHFVETLNNVTVVFNRNTCQRVATVTHSNFFKTSDGHRGGQDPRIIYDPDLSRWIAVAQDADAFDSLIFAISNSSDPVGTGASGWENTYWRKYHFVARAGQLRDFPTLGVDRNGIYVAVNVFGGDLPQVVIIAIPKTEELLDGGVPDFQRPTVAPEGTALKVIQPAVNFDPISATDPALFITQDRSAPSSKVRVGRLTWSGTTATIDQTWPSIDLPKTGADLEQSVPPNDSNGTYPLDPSHLGSQYRMGIHWRGWGSKYTMAVVRNGYLWTCHTIGVNANGLYNGTWPNYGDADRTACEWLKFEIIADGSTKTLKTNDYGRVYETSIGRSYYMPSLAVNSRGDVVMGYSGSGSSEYVGAYYAGRLASAPGWSPSDPSHKVNSVFTLIAGADAFDHHISNYSLWGDYSYTCVDPNDDLTFWTVQEYAKARWWSTAFGVYFPEPNWGTHIAAIPPF